MLNMRNLVAATAISLGMVGAAQAEIIYSVDYYPNYSPLEFSSYATGETGVEIIGVTPDGASPEAIAAQISISGFGGPATFYPLPASEATTGAVRLVFAFGAAPGATGYNLCKGEVSASATTFLDRSEVSGAFCIGRHVASEGRMRFFGQVGPSDPAFAPAMRRFIHTIAPPRDPGFGLGRGCRRRSC